MTNKTWGSLGVVALVASIAIAFQNCSGKGAEGSGVSASSCLDSSVLRSAFPQGTSIDIPMGVSQSPYSCVNQSDYSTLVFDSSKQTVTLQGSSGSVVFNLLTGGDACSKGTKIGGDRWKSASGETLDTNLNVDTIQVAYKNDISCTTTR